LRDVTADEPRPFELVSVTAAMARHGVNYVLIGGVSGMLHGMSEYRTKDVDLLVQDNAANRDRLAAAMNELNAVPLRSANREAIIGDDFMVGSTQWETDAGDVDILISATGPDETIIVYSDIERREEYVELDDGQRVPVASLDDVIRMKEAANRTKTTSPCRSFGAYAVTLVPNSRPDTTRSVTSISKTEPTSRAMVERSRPPRIRWIWRTLADIA
jgi:hypothetical protein